MYSSDCDLSRLFFSLGCYLMHLKWEEFITYSSNISTLCDIINNIDSAKSLFKELCPLRHVRGSNNPHTYVGWSELNPGCERRGYNFTWLTHVHSVNEMTGGWNSEATKALLGLWGDSSVQSQLDGMVRNKTIYLTIAKKLNVKDSITRGNNVVLK